MRLRKFRVKAYRCIHDSGEITVGDLAAFVGRNESGKTTILQALTLLNRGEKISELDLCDELSEELKSEIKLVDGEFELNQREINMIKEKFPNLPEIKKLKIYRTNNSTDTNYDFGNLKISDEQNKAINSWENFTSNIFGFLDTIPNHIRIQLDTKFFEGESPKSAEIFDSAMADFSNKFHVLANEEPQVVKEWESINSNPDNQFSNLLKGTSDRTALENFIEANLHPRFVYFSDYKKIYGNIKLNEYLKETKGEGKEGIEYIEM